MSRIAGVALAALVAAALAACAGPRTVLRDVARPAPIADRPINLQGQCTQTEADGFREHASVDIRDNDVRALAWEIQVGRRGSCRFDQADFRQTKSRPHIELLARDGSGCTLMVWQEPRRITLAHAGCEQRCSAGVYAEAWPVMFDPGTGRCARS